MNIGSCHSLNSTTKFLFQAGLLDTFSSRFTRYPKYFNPLMINIWNHPTKRFLIGINVELFMLKWMPLINERRERDVLHILLLCWTFKHNWTARGNWTASTHSRQATVSRWVERNLFIQQELRAPWESEAKYRIWACEQTGCRRNKRECSPLGLKWFIRWFSTFLSKSVRVRTVQDQLTYASQKSNRSRLMKW